jgi:cytochrome c556
MTKLGKIVVLTGMGLLTVGALAQAAGTDDALKRAKKIEHLRGSVMSLVGWNVGPMVAIIKEQAPYDQAVFRKQAPRITALARMVDELFEEDLRAFDLKTEAKPAIWDDRAEFSRLAGQLVDNSQSLENIAGAGDEAATKKAFLAVLDSCKACHDKFKAD